MVWIWPCPDGGTLSSPTVLTAVDPANPSSTGEAVLVTSSNGYVYMLQAFPVNQQTGQLSGSTGSILPPAHVPNPGWQFSSVPPPTPYPPLYLNGWICCSMARLPVRLQPISAQAAGSDEQTDPRWSWQVPSSASATAITPPTATPRSGPSFGFVTNQGTGAIVGTLMWTTGPWSNPLTTTSAGQPMSDCVCGIPVQVTGDRLSGSAWTPAVSMPSAGWVIRAA